jgi:hypothetical protein
MLSEKCLSPDVFVSGAIAVESSTGFSENYIFISANESVWGTLGKGNVEHLGKVPVDNGGSLTYYDALRCSSEDESVLKYSKRFLGAVNGVLSPKRILFACDLLSEEYQDRLEDEFSNVHCVSALETVLNGLMELVRDQILKEISLKR